MNSALIVVDMLNSYEHEDADTLTESVREALPSIEALIERARREDVPIVYVNDNYGGLRRVPARACTTRAGRART